MEFERQPTVYIMASRYRGTLYIGVTSDLWTRIADHKNESFGGFTAQYNIKTLVWYEHHSSMPEAIKRETQMKTWKRQWKIELVETFNRDWRDLHNSIHYRPHQPL